MGEFETTRRAQRTAGVCRDAGSIADHPRFGPLQTLALDVHLSVLSAPHVLATWCRATLTFGDLSSYIFSKGSPLAYHDFQQRRCATIRLEDSK